MKSNTHKIKKKVAMGVWKVAKSSDNVAKIATIRVDRPSDRKRSRCCFKNFHFETVFKITRFQSPKHHCRVNEQAKRIKSFPFLVGNVVVYSAFEVQITDR